MYRDGWHTGHNLLSEWLVCGFWVKNETGKVTKLQDATLRKIMLAGGRAVVVRSVEDVKKVVACFVNGGRQLC